MITLADIKLERNPQRHLGKCVSRLRWLKLLMLQQRAGGGDGGRLDNRQRISPADFKAEAEMLVRTVVPQIANRGPLRLFAYDLHLQGLARTFFYRIYHPSDHDHDHNHFNRFNPVGARHIYKRVGLDYVAAQRYTTRLAARYGIPQRGQKVNAIPRRSLFGRVARTAASILAPRPSPGTTEATAEPRTEARAPPSLSSKPSTKTAAALRPAPRRSPRGHERAKARLRK